MLDQEIAVVAPAVIVCPGATAAQALLGKDFRVTQERGIRLESPLAVMRATETSPRLK